MEAPATDELRRYVESQLGSLAYAYVIDWIPEQGSNIYTVVLPERRIATVEIPKPPECDLEPTIEVSTLAQYGKINGNFDNLTQRKLLYIESLLGRV